MQAQTANFYYRKENKKALLWEGRLKRWLKANFPQVKITPKKPQVLIVLGGDGTILEAARKFHEENPLIVGLNLGRIGFLASARRPPGFTEGLENVLKGKYRTLKRMMLSVSVKRGGKTVFKGEALNDIVVQSLLGMVGVEIAIEGYPVQKIRGNGVLVATSTGSTAYNLSAHGPVVMPDIKCFIITELLDHDTPTPSIVVKRNRKISLKILNFRKLGKISLSQGGKPTDVILFNDGDRIFPLEKGDLLEIKRSSHLAKFAELEPNYFFKSLQEKFSFG